MVWTSHADGGTLSAGDARAAAPVAYANPQSMPGNMWKHPCFEEDLAPECVAIGDAGTLVFTDIEGFGTFARTFASSDHTPASAVSQSPTTYSRRSCVVRVADQTDVRVDLAYVKTGLVPPTVPVLTRTSFTDPAHDWSYPFPFSVADTENSPLGLGISRDGNTIVATVFKRTQFRQSIAVFNSGSSTPTLSVDVPVSSDPLRYAVSADGSTLFVLSLSYTLIFDTQSGATTYYADNFEYPTAGIAISGDGSYFAKSFSVDHRVEVYRKQLGTYGLFSTYHPTGVGQCYTLAISDDASTLVAGFWDVIFPGQTATVTVLDVTSPTAQVAFQDAITGSGPLWNLIQDLVVSKDGSTFAVGLTGSESGSVPQLLAYRRDPLSHSWSKVLQAHLAGSALDLDLSPDGSKVAVASMRGHMEAPLGGGEIGLYRLEAQDLVLDAVPEPGVVVPFRIAPTFAVSPGTHVALLEAPLLSHTAHSFPNLGTLYLDRMLVHSAGLGTVDAAGVATISLTLPAGSSSVGTTNYYQSLCLSPRRLSETWVKLTIVP
jgi:hypothetical protein